MWHDIARGQGGVITTWQLTDIGVSGDMVTRMVRDGRLVRLGHGVYLAGGAPLTTYARLWTAVLTTGGVLGRSTAGRLWGVWEGESVEIQVLVTHDRRVAVPRGVRIHRQVSTPVRTVHRSGLPVTSREWTTVDLIATLTYRDASRLADRALQQGWISRGSCRDRVRALPHRPGNRQLRRIDGQLGDGAASTSERLLHRLVRRAGTTGWKPNYDVWVDGELIAVVDVAVPDRRIAIEVDGMAYHVDVDRFRRDRRRQNALVQAGWTVIRFTWADLTERPGYVIGVLRRLAP